MEKKSEDMHIRMEAELSDFLAEVATSVERPRSTVARLLLWDWLRLGRRATAEAIEHLEDGTTGRTPPR